MRGRMTTEGGFLAVILLFCTVAPLVYGLVMQYKRAVEGYNWTATMVAHWLKRMVNKNLAIAIFAS